MNETIIAALIGVLAGTLPVLLTRVFAMVESRSSLQRQKKIIELKKLQLESLEQYLKVAKTVQSETQQTEKNQNIIEGLASIQASLLNIHSEPQVCTSYKDRPLLQRFLLLYPADTTSGWISRLMYYMTGFGLTAIYIDLYLSGEAFTGIDDTTGLFEWGFWAGEWIGAGLFLLIPYFFHRKAAKSE